jgi:hypothetical protein
MNGGAAGASHCRSCLGQHRPGLRCSLHAMKGSGVASAPRFVAVYGFVGACVCGQSKGARFAIQDSGLMPSRPCMRVSGMGSIAWSPKMSKCPVAHRQLGPIVSAHGRDALK